ncbi:MAG TPA: CpaD family pilus assembly protein [Xanthobacteraceae bacterium]|nr:CpaD family pilus assembly protein [Xanthobacteraceae bacterium]
MQTVRTMIVAGRVARAGRGIAASAVRAALFAGSLFLVCGCNTDQQVAGVPDVPPDYRLRHPITIREADRTLQVFIGSNRSELTPSQRAEVLAFAQTWRREATGGVVVELPAGTSNERASAEAWREIQSILAATGVPPQGIIVRSYHVTAHTLATIRITYPKIAAQAGPCGLWPADIGPSFNRDYFENQPFWNLGCASQRNLAAMVDNPADLVQPRAETPSYTQRRTTVFDKYREGAPTATPNQSSESAKISEVGK